MSTSRVDIGIPVKNLRGWTNTEVNFHGFANLSTTKDDENRVASPEFSCFGHQWRLDIFPGGTSNSHEGHVGVGLANKSNSNIKIQYGYSVRNADGEEVASSKSKTKEFGAYDSEDGDAYKNAWCTSNFAQRSTIMNVLVDSSLFIEVRMKCMSTDKSITQFIPTNPINKNVLQKFMDEETANVVFEVDNRSCQGNKHTNKKTKTTTTFYAHRFILQDISTMLSELCKSDESGGVTTVSVTDVKPEIFKHMIYYTYGGELSQDDLKNNAKDIINACDKYGVVHLKLEAEAWYVESNEITIDNMIDNLLYADSKNLALLKEAVMDYILANKGDVIGKVSFDNLPSSMMTDLLTAVARGEEAGDESSDGNDEEESTKYYTMRVGVLRKMLDEKGLDVDGSREAMIALLKENLEV